MHYDLVIIGATATALGLAKTVKAACKTLILNRTEMVAYEYVHTFKVPGVYAQGAQYCKEFLDLGVDILLKTEITAVKKDGEGYTLEIFNNAGFQTVSTKVLVDTTTERGGEISGKSLNCLLVNPNKEEISETDSKGITYLADSDERFNTVIMKYNCDVGISLCEARHQLIDFWHQRPDSLKDWKIVTIGFAFEEKPVIGYSKKEENYYRVPSAYFDNPTASMEAGVALGRGLIA